MTDQENIYGSFLLRDDEFAISVKAIQEVVNEPECYNPVPLAPEYLLGLFNLRGMIIPVIDLSKIFNLAETNKIERKVAIIEHGNLCVGILFDETCEVFNEKDVEKNLYNDKREKQQEKVIEGIFKMNGGERIIQILNPYELLNLKDVPKTDDSVAQKINIKKRGARRQCISFQVGDSICALGINCIQEIVKVDKINDTVLNNEICLGAINVRENTIPVINFDKVLGYESLLEKGAISLSDCRVIIMKLEEELFGLLVNSVESIISFFEDEILAFPVLNETKKEMFNGCLQGNRGEQIIILDNREILSHGEIDRITRGHANLYKIKNDSQTGDGKREVNRKTYITFSVGDRYALEINEVQEVIDFPEEIIVPPNVSKHFIGMITLRGDLIPIIDPRLLYQMKSPIENRKFKILIFRSGNDFLGLMVDTVDSIVSFNDDEKINLPELIYRGAEKSINRDVKEAIQVTSGDFQDRVFLVLNLKVMVSRISYNMAA